MDKIEKIRGRFYRRDDSKKGRAEFLKNVDADLEACLDRIAELEGFISEIKSQAENALERHIE